MATFPATIKPARLDFSLVGNTRTFRSELAGDEQVLKLPGAHWVVSMTFDLYTRAELAELEAFLHDLEGAAGTFSLWNHRHENPRGSAPGTPLVKGASQGGKSLITDGWTVSQSAILKPGDFFAVNGELKQITAEAASDGSGDSTLAITPALRASPADGAALTTTKALGTFRLTTDAAARIQHLGPHMTLSLTAREHF